MKAPEVMFGEKKIQITETYAKKARNTKSDEYSDLCDLIKQHPGYQVVVLPAAKRKRTDTMKGLSYECMEKYIRSQDGEDSASLAEFKDLIRTVSYGNEKSEHRAYGEVKAWFLRKYPCVAEHRAKTDRILGKAS